MDDSGVVTLPVTPWEAEDFRDMTVSEDLWDDDAAAAIDSYVSTDPFWDDDD